MVKGRTSRSRRSSVTLDSALTPDQGCLNGALMSASLVNVKEHFSHLMLNHPAVNRPVRTRMRGGVGSGGEKPPLTRLEPRKDPEAPGKKPTVTVQTRNTVPVGASSFTVQFLVLRSVCCDILNKQIQGQGQLQSSTQLCQMKL